MIEKSLFTYFIEAFTKNYVNFKGALDEKSIGDLLYFIR